MKSVSDIVLALSAHGMLPLLSDRRYIEMRANKKLGYHINLEKPKTFQEKLQWLKLNTRDERFSLLVDKYEAKKIVSQSIGEEYTIPTLNVWDRFDEINFETLPNQFVLKCTHDSGGVTICRDKRSFNTEDARKKIEKNLKLNFYLISREWPYKNVKPRIICEPYMVDEKSEYNDLTDYKVYCFNGEPVYCQVISNRTEHECIDFFDMQWNHMDFVGLKQGIENAPKTPQKPTQYDLMKDLAKKLIPDTPFVRIDFYEINGKVYFGEITFFPGSGYGTFTPSEWNLRLGEMIRLPIDK